MFRWSFATQILVTALTQFSYGQEITFQFNPPDTVKYIQTDSSFRALYWWEGQEDYATREVFKTTVLMVKTDSEYVLSYLPSLQHIAGGIDTSRFLEQSTTRLRLDNEGRFVELLIPPSIRTQLELLQPAAAKLQKSTLYRKYWTDWYFQKGQFLGRSAVIGDSLHDTVRMPATQEDSVSYSRQIKFLDRVMIDENEFIRVSFSYLADTSDFSHAMRVMKGSLLKSGLVQENGYGDDKGVSYGNEMNGEVTINPHTMHVRERSFVQDQITYEADGRSTRWRTVHYSRTNDMPKDDIPEKIIVIKRYPEDLESPKDTNSTKH